MSRSIIQSQRHLQIVSHGSSFTGSVRHSGKCESRQDFTHRPVRQPLREVIHFVRGTPNTLATSPPPAERAW